MPAVEELYAKLGMPKRIDVLGVPVDPWSMSQTIEATKWLVDHRCFAHLIGVNADKVLQMLDDAEMDAYVHGCEVINADGASMVMAAEKLGNPVPERVAGVDLMQELCAVAAREGWRVYLLGAKEEVVQATAEALKNDCQGIDIVGLRDGYFTDGEFNEVAKQVSATSPDLVFVGITSPKKERLIERFRELGMAGVFVGVGGTFDVLSGDIPRAPLWMQNARLEWLFRLVQEPRRLFKRYVVGNTRFMILLYREKFKQRKAG